ncbi:hypothetical protein [Pseudodesulfovibrio indicus]|uniref:Uncharacterized protein n=1 Tax=Pseudodesulfovibrio indicus TaxID=1716143 RepID=A0A126QKF5_9BACT|nr:hypothetical protein [Pseudodesulfovibrio indicus]AMK10287.1 hypothetical protein AWY79_03720 [Pseudodesulfovibrio indicus]TDT82008.1 hypothetical protein EDC59_11827 [Pseudodesulfovibrio indicus]
MKRIPLASLSLLALAALLPGCLAANAALGVMGLFGPPAVQLVGAAYAVAEYSYEYSVNDRTPDEVIAARLSWVFPTDDGPSMTEYASAFRRTVTAGDPRIPTATLPQGATEPTLTALAAPEPDPAPLSALRAVPKPASRPVAVQKPGLRKSRTVPAQVAQAARPQVRRPVLHAYVERAADPLLERLQRMEQGLRQAESLYLADGDGGLLLSVPAPEADPSAQGVSGSWSIRHPVMKTVPGPVLRPVQSTADSSRSLNT